MNGIENELAKYGIQREYGVINADERIKRVGEHVQWKKQEIRQQAERNKMNERRWNHRRGRYGRKVEQSQRRTGKTKRHGAKTGKIQTGRFFTGKIKCQTIPDCRTKVVS